MRETRAPYLERRGPVFRVRFQVPLDLSERVGLTEVRRSLQTGDPSVAQKRALAARIWFADVVEMLRGADAGRLPSSKTEWRGFTALSTSGAAKVCQV